MGIWFAIGLTHPEATSTLIHNFVFGWAMEWVFFMVELTTIAVYYYTWNRIDEKLHLKVGWVYAGASVATLIIINGILAFMLTPGDTWIAVAGTGHEASKFWNAFFNPTYWPSLLLRTGVCTSLAGIWALITSSRIDGDKQPALKTSMVKWSVKWLVPSFRGHAVPAGVVPLHGSASQRALLTLGIDTINGGTFSTVTRMALIIIITSATIIGVAYFLAYRNPVDFNFSHAVAVSDAGSHCYGRRRIQRAKCFASRTSLAAGCIRMACECLMSPVSTRGLSGALHLDLERLGVATSYSRGEAIFRGECASCHTLDGYRPLRRLLDGRDRTNIRNFIVMLHENKPDSPYRQFMPPMAGTQQDIDDLADFLNAQVNPPIVASKTVLTAQK